MDKVFPEIDEAAIKVIAELVNSAADSVAGKLAGGDEMEKTGKAYNPIGRTEGAVRGLSYQIISMYERGYKDGKADAEIPTGGIIRVGETYRIDSYQAVCVSKNGDRCLMQTLGMTAGPWPGEGDISDYDDKTREFYQKWSPAVSDMCLLSDDQVEISDLALAALEKAARARSSFGADFSYAWLGSVYGSSYAWFVDYGGSVYYGNYQGNSYVVAPAFDLDESKIILDGDEIKLKPSTDKKHHDEFDEAWEAVKTICPELVELENATDETGKEAYQRGLDDAWEIARKITTFSVQDMLDCFNEDYSDADVMWGLSVECAIKKVKEYEEKKKGQEEFKVGDEVEKICDGEFPMKYVVIRIEKDKQTFEGINPHCGVDFDLRLDTYRRTGRHFPQITEVLKQMQEAR